MTITKETGIVNTTYKADRPIKYIVLHYTAGTRSTAGAAKDTAIWFRSGKAGGSADFIVDDATVVQYNPEPKNRYCWAVGGSKYGYMSTREGGKFYGLCTNTNSVSIEMCSRKCDTKNLGSYDTDWYLTDETVNNAAELTMYLMQLYGVPPENVIMHHHVTGKPCPNPWCVNADRLSAWGNFKKRLTEGEIHMDELKKLQARVDELERELTNSREKYFENLEDVPEWGRPTVEKLVREGVLKGDGKGLDLSYTLLRLLVINDRAGIYD